MTILLAYQGNGYSVVGSDLVALHEDRELFVRKIEQGNQFDFALTGKAHFSTSARLGEMTLDAIVADPFSDLARKEEFYIVVIDHSASQLYGGSSRTHEMQQIKPGHSVGIQTRGNSPAMIADEFVEAIKAFDNQAGHEVVIYQNGTRTLHSFHYPAAPVSAASLAYPDPTLPLPRGSSREEWAAHSINILKGFLKLSNAEIAAHRVRSPAVELTRDELTSYFERRDPSDQTSFKTIGSFISSPEHLIEYAAAWERAIRNAPNQKIFYLTIDVGIRATYWAKIGEIDYRKDPAFNAVRASVVKKIKEIRQEDEYSARETAYHFLEGWPNSPLFFHTVEKETPYFADVKERYGPFGMFTHTVRERRVSITQEKERRPLNQILEFIKVE